MYTLQYISVQLCSGLGLREWGKGIRVRSAEWFGCKQVRVRVRVRMIRLCVSWIG